LDFRGRVEHLLLIELSAAAINPRAIEPAAVEERVGACAVPDVACKLQWDVRRLGLGCWGLGVGGLVVGDWGFSSWGLVTFEAAVKLIACKLHVV